MIQLGFGVDCDGNNHKGSCKDIGRGGWCYALGAGLTTESYMINVFCRMG